MTQCLPADPPPAPSALASPLGLYVHIPFCRAKCAYCDFTSFAGMDGLFDRYVSAVVREVEGPGLGSIQTLYVGGGTPTLLPNRLLARILEAAHRLVGAPAREVSLEANPGTVDAGSLAGLRAMGITRLSLGVQSFDAGELALLGRIHTADEAMAAFRDARRAGFENISLDLIYGLPRQDLATWRATLEAALALQPEHLSAYCLSIEEGTVLSGAIARGVLPEPDTDRAADMYEVAQERLAAAGYLHYEISNWARDGAHRCRHNLIYWRNEAYRGVGAAAHSWDGRRRWSNVASPPDYVDAVEAGRSPVVDEESVQDPLHMAETVILGLRLVEEGVELGRFRERFGTDLAARYRTEIAKLAETGLLEVSPDRIRLTPRGRLLGNQVFLRFLPA